MLCCFNDLAVLWQEYSFAMIRYIHQQVTDQFVVLLGKKVLAVLNYHQSRLPYGALKVLYVQVSFFLLGLWYGNKIRIPLNGTESYLV